VSADSVSSVASETSNRCTTELRDTARQSVARFSRLVHGIMVRTQTVPNDGETAEILPNDLAVYPNQPLAAAWKALEDASVSDGSKSARLVAIW
jgi:hypothetical protein